MKMVIKYACSDCPIAIHIYIMILWACCIKAVDGTAADTTKIITINVYYSYLFKGTSLLKTSRGLACLRKAEAIKIKT